MEGSSTLDSVQTAGIWQQEEERTTLELRTHVVKTSIEVLQKVTSSVMLTHFKGPAGPPEAEAAPDGDRWASWKNACLSTKIGRKVNITLYCMVERCVADVHGNHSQTPKSSNLAHHSLYGWVISKRITLQNYLAMHIYKNSVHVDLIHVIIYRSIVQYHVCWIQGLTGNAAFLILHSNRFFKCRDGGSGRVEMSGWR